MPIINQVVKGGGGTRPTYYVEKKLDANGKLVQGDALFDFTGVRDIGSNILQYAFYENTNIRGQVSMPDLVTLSGQYALGYCFNRCIHITSFSMPVLATITNSYALSFAFGNTGITSAVFPALTSITAGLVFDYCFAACNSLTKAEFPSLSTAEGYAIFENTFINCSALEDVYFYALTPSSFGTGTTLFNNMLQNCSGVTVHFPMAIQSTISSWSSVTDGFSGTNTTVLFDIVTSLTGADSNTYSRSQKNSTSTAIAWTYNDTIYYTSGTSEPSVGDTIYSDAACTTTVTTIDSIA